MIKKQAVYFMLLGLLVLHSSSTSSISAHSADHTSSGEMSRLDDAPVMKEWTFMVYLDGDNNLEAAALDDINEMEAAGGSTADVNIIVLVDLCESDSGGDSEYGVTWTEARIYYIEAGSDDIEIESTLISEEGELNMGKGETLTNFVDFVMTNYPAERYGLSLWDHGGGLEGICWDWDNNDNCIGINELQEALDGYHFDFIGMDACIMGQYEIVYEISPSADYVGVSLLNEPGDGWDYENFLPYLLADPYMTGDVLGEHICTTYVDQYGLGVAFGIWNTTDMTYVQTEIDELAIVLIDNLDTYAEEIGLARELANSDGYPNYGAELYEFVVNLQDSTSIEIVQQASETQTALEDINIMSYSSYPVHPFGLWIYFPRIPNEDYQKFYANSGDQYVNQSPNPYYGLDFAINSSWGEFIYAWRDALPDALYTLSDDETKIVTATIDEYFAVNLVAGDKITAELTADDLGELNIYMYNALGRIVDYDDTSDDPKEVQYVATENCSAYLGVIIDGYSLNYSYELSINIDSRPYFSTITTTPESPGFGANVGFYSEIIDGHGLAEVILSYNTTSGWTNVSMSESGENIYSVSISNEESVRCLMYKIYATDNEGNSRISATKSLIFHEELAPEIIDIKLDPKKPKSGEEVEITVEASDESGIDKVILSYDFGEGWKNETIYDDDLDKYIFTLQIPENISFFSYQIYVFDTWGNCIITDSIIVELNVGTIPISPLMTVITLAVLAVGHLQIRTYKKKKE